VQTVGENLVLSATIIGGCASVAKPAKRTSRALENGFGFYLSGTKNMSWHKERDDPNTLAAFKY
jgi:hypothetical protein